MKHSMNKTMLRLCLQFFADGSGGTGSSAGGASTGGGASDAGLPNSGEGTTAVGSDNAQDADVQAQGDEGNSNQAPDREAEFEAFIAEHSDLFNARVKAKVDEILPKRTRTMSRKARGYDAVLPLIDNLTARYGTEPGDIEALIKAVTEDKATRSIRAEELGVSEDMVEELERYRTREVTEQRQAREVQDEEKYARWNAEAASVREMYPGFNLRTEMQNPLFRELADKVGVRGAYVAIHHDEIQRAAVRFTAREASRRGEDNAVSRVRANGSRPQENGTRQRSASTTRVDPSKFTSEQIDEVIRKARAGQKISFQ